MTIRELLSVGYAPAQVTVTLSYDDVRCITNSLYQLLEVSKFKGDNPVELESHFNSVYGDMTQLFALIKHGKLCEDHIKTIYNLQNPVNANG